MKYRFLSIIISLTIISTLSCAKNNNYKANNKEINVKYAGNISAPDFPAGLAWLNTDKSITLKDIKGKVVLLDFWTFCCINCMHIIPDLKRLEAEFPNELVVIGVHSAKFDNEKNTESIKNAILRYGIEHPVVNDRDFQIWSSYAIRAWPSVALINPRGKVVSMSSGEGVYERLHDFIKDMIAEFDAAGEIDHTPFKLKLEKLAVPHSLIAFPGKIVADKKRGIIYFTDSNNNRIIAAKADGTIINVIGSGKQGKSDGNFETSEFFHPQGIALDEDANILYIADTENHLIRKVNLIDKSVSTLAGNGTQASYGGGEGTGTSAVLNSPWDLALKGTTLYIAMAGNHQIWSLNLNNLKAKAFAGNGREDIIDGFLASSSFAQPSGIVLAGNKLYVADSEVSGIREINLDNGRVTTLIGTGLFDFGDIDGKYPTARLQHPIGLTYANGKIYIADTYNNRIRVLDPETGILSKFIGSGMKGNQDGDFATAELNEPNGLCAIDDFLYICDTNNDLIKVADLKTGKITSLMLKPIPAMKPASALNTKQIKIGPKAITIGNSSIMINLIFPEGKKLNLEGVSTVSIISKDNLALRIPTTEFTLKNNKLTIPLETLKNQATSFVLALDVFYCTEGKEALCYFESKQYEIILDISSSAPKTVSLDLGI